MTTTNSLKQNIDTMETLEITTDALTSVTGGGLAQGLNDFVMSHLMTWVSPGHSGYGFGQAANTWLEKNIGP
jgi:hypothetical protein